MNSHITAVKNVIEHSLQTYGFTPSWRSKCTLRLHLRRNFFRQMWHVKVHFKPTDMHQLLHRGSFSPAHTFHGVAKSKFIRFKRISTTYEDYAEASAVLIKVLITGAYNQSKLQKLKSLISQTCSTEPKCYNNTQEKQEIIPVVMRYDNFHAHLNKRWDQLICNNPVFKNVRVI